MLHNSKNSCLNSKQPNTTKKLLVICITWKLWCAWNGSTKCLFCVFRIIDSWIRYYISTTVLKFQSYRTEWTYSTTGSLKYFDELTPGQLQLLQFNALSIWCQTGFYNVTSGHWKYYCQLHKTHSNNLVLLMIKLHPASSEFHVNTWTCTSFELTF